MTSTLDSSPSGNSTPSRVRCAPCSSRSRTAGSKGAAARSPCPSRLEGLPRPSAEGALAVRGRAADQHGTRRGVLHS
jgi:hypothetical protein